MQDKWYETLGWWEFLGEGNGRVRVRSGTQVARRCEEGCNLVRLGTRSFRLFLRPADRRNAVELGWFCLQHLPEDLKTGSPYMTHDQFNRCVQPRDQQKRQVYRAESEYRQVMTCEFDIVFSLSDANYYVETCWEKLGLDVAVVPRVKISHTRKGTATAKQQDFVISAAKDMVIPTVMQHEVVHHMFTRLGTSYSYAFHGVEFCAASLGLKELMSGARAKEELRQCYARHGVYYR